MLTKYVTGQQSMLSVKISILSIELDRFQNQNYYINLNAEHISITPALDRENSRSVSSLEAHSN